MAQMVVVGCGGTGSAVLSGLPYLHDALLAAGHPAGVMVYAVDGDRVRETNCVRQPFTSSEIGLYKTHVLMQRLNLFWGLDWVGIPAHVLLSPNACLLRLDQTGGADATIL